LGWLPLAIELQAARTARGAMSVAQLNADLERDHSQGLLGDPLDATHNLRYSFDQSLRTLTPLQRTRFAAFGLPGGPDWSRDVIVRMLADITEQDATASAAAANAIASAQADLDLLAALLLVTPAEGCIRLHPLLRDYAHELWRNEPDATQAAGLSALLAGIYDLADEYEHDFASLAQEEELIVAALDLAQAGHADPSQIIAIVNTLIDYLNLGGHWNTGIRLHSWQLAAYRTAGDHRGEGRILNNLGYLAKYLGQPEQARHYYEQALAILQEIGEVDTTRVVTDNLTSLDAAATAFAEAHDTSAIPQEKAPSPKRRRWPWQRKRTY